MGLVRTLVSIALAGLLVGAGCLGPGREAGSPVQPTDAGGEPVGGGGPAAAPDPRAGDPSSTFERVFHGQMGAEAFACTGAGCVGSRTCLEGVCLDARDPRVERVFEIPREERFLAVNLTMTWAPVSPATERLRLGISWGCEDGCDGFEMTQGEAPLELGVPGLGVQDGLVIWAWTPDATTPQDPVYVGVTHDQAFTIEAAVTVSPAWTP